MPISESVRALRKSERHPVDAGVIDVVLVDAVAKAGWAELEGLKSVVATPVLA